jgi:hypothetical protein
MPVNAITVYFMAGILFFLSAINCSNHKKEMNCQGSGIIMTTQYPVVQKVNDTLHFFNLFDTIAITFCDKYILYQLPRTRILQSEQRMANQDKFFLHSRDSIYGVLFKTAEPKFESRMMVDSFVNMYALGRLFIQPTDNDTIVEKEFAKGKIKLEKYIPKRKPSEDYFDSLFFYYSNDISKEVNFSLSKQLDSIKKSKLVEIRIIYNEEYSIKNSLLLPHREYVFKISPMAHDSIRQYCKIINENTIKK